MSNSVKKMAQDLRGAIDFLQTVGVDINKGRVSRYLEVFDNYFESGNLNNPLLFAAAYEGDDIAKIKDIPLAEVQKIRHRLSRISSGDETLTTESDNDQGRDLLFEIAVAHFLQNISGAIRLDSPSDVVSNIGETALLVECKRPTTGPALARRIKEGYRQISEHRRQGYSGLGVVALEVSLLVNPNFGVLIAQDSKSAIDGLYIHIQKVLSMAKEELDRAARNRRQDAGVDLLMFRAKCMSGDNISPPYITTVWHLEPLTPLWSPEFMLHYKAFSAHENFQPGITVF